MDPSPLVTWVLRGNVMQLSVRKRAQYIWLFKNNREDTIKEQSSKPIHPDDTNDFLGEPGKFMCTYDIVFLNVENVISSFSMIF